jgi:5-methylcytosine-specific restriction enzyme subunit McrC
VRLRPIELTEWATTGSLPLEREEMRALSRVTVGDHRSRFVEVLAGSDAGEYRLRASSFVGALQAGPVQVIVRPKIGDAKALYLAAVARGLKPQADLVDLTQDADLVEIMVPLVLSAVERLLRWGLREEYAVVADDLPMLRGRVDFGRQLALRPGLPLPLSVQFEEFLRDTAANRVLRSALEIIFDRRLGSNDNRRKAHELLRNFDGVSTWQGARLADVLPPSTEYTHPLTLAKLLLSGSAVDLFAGAVKVDGLVFDMNSVFQDFVFEGLRSRLRGVVAGRLIPESRGVDLHLDKAKSVTLEPDFALWSDGTCRLVGDVKYKDLDARRLPNSDVYQVLAYAIGANLPTAMLIYAGSGPRFSLSVSHAGVEVKIFNLDLRRAISEIEDQLDVIAEAALADATP